MDETERRPRLIALVALSIQDKYRREDSDGHRAAPYWIQALATEIVDVLDDYGWLNAEPVKGPPTGDYASPPGGLHGSESDGPEKPKTLWGCPRCEDAGAFFTLEELTAHQQEVHR